MGGCEGPSVKRRRSEDDAEMEGLLQFMEKGIDILYFRIKEEIGNGGVKMREIV